MFSICAGEPPGQIYTRAPAVLSLDDDDDDDNYNGVQSKSARDYEICPKSELSIVWLIFAASP
jgi:hypothetical protein